MKTTTPFDVVWNCNAILDTGAPWTEVSDFLVFAGLLDGARPDIAIHSDLQTQRYDKFTIPQLTVCGHTTRNIEVRVSRINPSWEIAALIWSGFLPSLSGYG